MFKLKEKTTPSCFSDNFAISHNKYGTRFSNSNFQIQKSGNKQSDSRISYRGPYLWSKVLTEDLKYSLTLNHFKIELKEHLLEVYDYSDLF